MDLFFSLLALFFLSFFFYCFLILFLIIIFYFYFNNFILFYFFFLSFFFSHFSSEPCGCQGLGAPTSCQACAPEVGEPSSGHWPQRLPGST